MSLITTSAILALPRTAAFEGIGGVPVKVTQASWAPGADVDAVIGRTLAPDAFTATSDGRGVHVGWHEGASDDAAYFERYERQGDAYVRISHGWVDVASRRIVQTG